MPVVVMSADTSPGQRQRLQTQGAADYLSKPFDVMQLLAIVDAREDSKP
jgi:DNA-binding response OmpR family regulator